jgi:hypothetical protein
VLRYVEETVRVPEDIEYCEAIKLVLVEFLTDVKVFLFRRYIAD